MTDEPILAWRKWRVRPSDGLLRSLHKDAVWPPGRRLEARCMPRNGDIVTTNRACDSAPTFKCHCGIHAVDSREEVHRFGTTVSGVAAMYRRTPVGQISSLTVIGRVSLWGHWVRCESGWRAQYAYPYDLYVQRPSHTLEGMEIVQATSRLLREQYLVDVTWE